MDRYTLLAIRRNDPDGFEHREPTARDYANFRSWLITAYGADAWEAYNRPGWDEGAEE